MLQQVERTVDLLDPALNTIENMSLEEARARVLSGDAAAVGSIEGSFAIVARDGITVRLARTLDRPMRYFLAKRQEGPALFVADRIDTLHRALEGEGLAGQFHPSYTRMVPAHHVVEIGRRYAGAASLEIHKWLRHVERETPAAPIGVCFSGGIDSGAVFLLIY